MAGNFEGIFVESPAGAVAGVLTRDLLCSMLASSVLLTGDDLIISALVHGVALAVAEPEYAVAAMYELMTPAQWQALVGGLRRFVAAHPIARAGAGMDAGAVR